MAKEKVEAKREAKWRLAVMVLRWLRSQIQDGKFPDNEVTATLVQENGTEVTETTAMSKVLANILDDE